MRRRINGRRASAVIDIGAWTPKTRIGEKVKAGQINTIEEIFDQGKPILETEIVDYLLPNLEYEVLEIRNTTRMTDCGRKMTFRVVVLVGDKNGHIGLGAGKSEEVKPAIESALKDAKKKIISVKKGCGSWECGCGKPHSLPFKTKGKLGSVSVELYPAPKGLGLVANTVIKKVLELAGINDASSAARGSTTNLFNAASATIIALDNINHMKV
ncbi:30S ribosomal protein S5 [Candidatus Micrarchaeota archaeon]|jgi:small subunit ribosomal protein S5|nr:30S ribosomal protein S5 [Candidatus Micrarchaeota archaeon]